MNNKDNQNEEFVNKTVMVTDLMERKDKEAAELLQYFEKNFDVKLSEIRKKYEE